jgi:RNA polymerase sigma-54 factor
MKQTLQLKLSQHLTLTPQLQQSIRLLQLSTVELNAEVERMLQENPLLEKAEAEGDDEPALASQIAATSSTEAAPTHDDDRAGGKEAGDEVRERTDVVDRTDFEDYSGGDSDWGGGSSSTTTTTASIRSRLRRARCATICCRSSRCSISRCATDSLSRR